MHNASNSKEQRLVEIKTTIYDIPAAFTKESNLAAINDDIMQKRSQTTKSWERVVMQY